MPSNPSSSPVLPSHLKARESLRKSFGRIPQVADIPDLIEMQKSSYESFLSITLGEGEQRRGERLEKVFRSVFPVEDMSGSARLEFVDYQIETPKYDVEECRHRDMTYTAPLK
ncbi:MAG: hypothetical protein OXF05_07190, partial [Hyphomicrobiales bacterium]|nr:hypothetical protein [Hyphomicrobiales bacterium]